MNTTMNMEKLEQDAADIFHQGFACSESVIYAIRKHFGIDLSDDAIAMSSGFPWGLGGGGCICGALAGGTRREPRVGRRRFLLAGGQFYRIGAYSAGT